ncbi:MAG: TonB family protein [Candidatus Omnitrophota bacterium]
MFDEHFLQRVDDDLRIVVGDIDTIWAQDLTRIAIANPSIADVIETKPSEALISAKAPGKTDVFIWDKHGKRKVTVWVFTENLDLVQSRITELLQSADIEEISLVKNDLEGKLVVSGEIDEAEKEDYEAIIEPFKDSIIDLVKENEKRELIEIDVQIAEINSSYSKNLGIEWTNPDGDSTYTFEETLPGGNVKQFTDIFRIGSMARTTALQAKINALITEGKGKILSKPKIVARSGEEASFLVGGQIPIVTTNMSSGGTSQENVTFKDYGVNLKIKATVQKDDKIDIDLNVDVSDVDTSRKVGDNVAYTTRSAQTKLFLDNNQTIILAGFMKDQNSDTIKKVPLAGSFPIFGFLFRSKESPSAQTELFITLTPRVVSANEKKKQTQEISREETKVQEEKKQDVITSLAKTETESAKPSYQPIAVPGAMAVYVRSVQERIAKNVFYPNVAKESKTQGMVELNVSIIKSGSLVSASIGKSSGSTVLDEAALETVHRLSPYSAFPPEATFKQITVTIPIVYQLD